MSHVTGILVLVALAGSSALAQDDQAHAHHQHGPSMEAMRPAPWAGWYSSGTSQVPAATPLYMLHASASGWHFMFQGQVFGVYTNQTGPRGRDKLFSANWFMPMASHRLGGGLLTVRSMFTLEPLTITGKRYPLLFQTGEVANRIPIIDRKSVV